METTTVIKSGRAFNGAHRDAGTIIHLIPKINPSGVSWDKALCGTEPGIRGNGWHQVDKPASCEKCIKKLKKV